MDLYKSADENNKMGLNINYNGNYPPGSDSANLLSSQQELSSEMMEELQKEDNVSDWNKGVQFVNLPNMFKVVYNGELAKNGAEDVYASIGYGNNERWEDVSQYPMNKTSYQTFELLTFRKQPGNVNIAFNDGSENWDNNWGQNYTFHDSSGEGVC